MLDGVPSQHKLMCLGILLRALSYFDAALECNTFAGVASLAANDALSWLLSLYERFSLLRDMGNVAEAAQALGSIRHFIKESTGNEPPAMPYMAAQYHRPPRIGKRQIS